LENAKTQENRRFSAKIMRYQFYRR